ncbi:unnamed protein product, partial [Rotaria sp. Silwood2]
SLQNNGNTVYCAILSGWGPYGPQWSNKW